MNFALKDIKDIEIKEGMLIVHKDGKYLVTRNCYDDLIAAHERGKSWFGIKDSCVEVEAIYDRPKLYAKTCQFSTSDRRLLWKKPEVKEMTVAEIEKELGYSVKVVKE